ncbi:MAG: hypothetical protein KGI52_03515 [Burkholderiales bacterium]|nr:hypothetical protein [Burkholderiales bacterium]
MTQDRELLELAAKAAGLWDHENSYVDIPWDPLIDDYDEARLECHLLMNVTWGMASVTVDSWTERYSDHDGDKQKARRYAGVRAAAAIGKAMQDGRGE